MIGPRPIKGVGGRGLVVSSRRPVAESSAQSARKRSKSRSRSPAAKKQSEKSDGKAKQDKEFAWMDSDNESNASKKSNKSSPSSPPAKPVPLREVVSLGQMVRQAPELEKRLKKGDLRSRELADLTGALARSKFFDGDLLEILYKELERACRKRTLNTQEIVQVICDMAELNAYNVRLFDEACSALKNGIDREPEAAKKGLEAALRRVKHDPGQSFIDKLGSGEKKSGSNKAACPLFFKGQCKWGPKCKLSHDDDAFERTIARGTWNSGQNKSQGYQQSADLFKDDRCGALW